MPFGHLAGKLQGLGGDNAHEAEQRDQDNQEQDEAGEGRGQDLIAPQQAGEGRVEGLGGEKQHQGHENVEEIRFDDEIGIIEHQQGDDAEKEPGEPGVQAFLDLHDRDGGAGRADYRAPEGGLDGRFRLPEDLVVVGRVQRGESLDGLDKVVALEEHEKGDEQRQHQVEKEDGKTFDETDGIGVNKGAGLGHRGLDDLGQS